MLHKDELTAYLYSMIQSLNTAIILDAKMSGNKSKFTMALAVDELLGNLVVDIISEVDYRYNGDLFINKNNALYIPPHENIIIGNPQLITYTQHSKDCKLNITRRYVLSVENVIKQISDLFTAYDNKAILEFDDSLHDEDGIIYKHNDLIGSKPRERAMGIIAKRMTGISHVLGLRMGEGSYVIPIANSSNEITEVTVEFNNLTNGHGHRVCFKCTHTLVKNYDDVVFARNLGSAIEIAVVGNNSVKLTDDHITMILNNETPTLLGDIYQDIKET